MTTIRPATPADHAAVVATFADAFSADPLFAWITGAYPGSELQAKAAIVFGTIVRFDLAKEDHLVVVSDDGAGAALWKAPDRGKMSGSEGLRSLPALLRACGVLLPRALRTFSAIEKLHPTTEHYYLEVLGTRSDAQGRGLGSTVIAEGLDRCDAEGLPAFLESSNPRNLGFYARHGFVETGVVPLGDDGPVVTTMWREPR